jgi:hypothetical protein
MLLGPSSVSLFAGQDSRSVLNGLAEWCNDTLDDMPHMATLRGSGRKLNHVPFAEGVLRVGDEESGNLGVVFADMTVPDRVAVFNSDCALHAADGDDGTALEGVGVFAKGGRNGGGCASI